jgi:acetylornithine deacetylase
MSAGGIAEVLARLTRLVAFDTRNPPRAIAGDSGLFAYLAAELAPGFSISVTDLGEGCVSLLAIRGAPSLLFNVHMDTVPADAGWARDPLRLAIEGDRAVGLGACDTKGAAACLITAALETQGDAALLFTSDEEAGTSRCVRHFLLENHRAFRGAVIAEPTSCRAVLEHRGIVSCSAEFRGTAGHASSPRALSDSALHEAVRWASAALAFAEEREGAGGEGLRGIRFNLGVLAGGTKSNMIASSATLRFGTRPPPSMRPEDLVAALAALAPRPERATFQTTYLGPPLPAPQAHGGPGVAAEALAGSLGLPAGAPVDFWTEAALFSAAGLPALVYGPGSIAQAHTAGEWVPVADLAEATVAYRRMLSDVRRESPFAAPSRRGPE